MYYKRGLTERVQYTRGSRDNVSWAYRRNQLSPLSMKNGPPATLYLLIIGRATRRIPRDPSARLLFTPSRIYSVLPVRVFDIRVDIHISLSLSFSRGETSREARVKIRTMLVKIYPAACGIARMNLFH